MTPELQGVELSVRIGDASILDGASIVLEPGTFVAVVGPNGAGKSTLCALLAGDAAPTAGQVLLGGRPLASWHRRQLARTRALLPQRAHVAGPFTVLDVALMGRHPWGEDAGDERIARHALDVVGASHLADRSWPTLSGGEQARVALARVLTQDAPILLLDEPTASLDIGHQHLVAAVARRHAEQGGSVLAVLHDVGLAAAYADVVVAMSGGRVVASGRPDEVLTSVGLTALYGHPVRVVRHPTQGWSLPVADRCVR